MRMVAGLGEDHRRRSPDGRLPRERRAGTRPRYGNGVRELRPLSAPERVRQHRDAVAAPGASRDRSSGSRGRRDLASITPLLLRRIRNLSGGQKQRVGIGRAIVREPRLFVMDEPISHLEARLRADMRTELKRLHHRLGVTTLGVTHDQLEAVALADPHCGDEFSGSCSRWARHPELVRFSSERVRRGLQLGQPAMNILAFSQCLAGRRGPGAQRGRW